LPDALSIAVVVPVLNEAGELVRRLPQLLSLNADELMIVDGGSTDKSLQLLQRAGVEVISGKPGRAAQMNAGASESKSDIILFLHIDTDCASSNLLAIKSDMQDAAAVGGRFDVHLSGHHPMFRIIGFFINLRSRLTRISSGDQAMFVRRDVFERMGGFSDIPLMEDIEFSRRLKRQGKIICLRQKVITSSRRWEKHGIGRTILLMWKLRLLHWLGLPAEKLAEMYRQAR